VKTIFRGDRGWARLGPVILVIWLASSTPRSAAAPARDSEPPPPRPLAGAPLPHHPADPTIANPLSTPAGIQVQPWTRVAFQSIRDGNWEIYAGYDGTGHVRLTDNPAADIHPRLNRGASRLVFASNRTGNYEIFEMNVDGSGLVQLTFDASDDVEPYWSPDGSRVAFQAYRDGQPEIYVMHADGSNPVRLTFNADPNDGNAYDAQPVWSPDGSRLAFVSKRTGGYRIWTMNADGTDPVQLSDQAYSFDPAWAPDGTRIAFDAAGSDGWQNLWVMNADGNGEQMLVDPTGPALDAWARSWSPDGRYLAYTRLQFVYVGDTWYWQSAVPIAYDLITHAETQLASQALDWHPDWASTDLEAPYSRVDNLGPYSRAGSSTIFWSGADVGIAGVATYDVQYRLGENGVWTDWRMATADTSAAFQGQHGTTTYFRSRARDRAGNVEPWPPTADTQTTLYTWALSGTVYDVRASPVVKAALMSAPEPVGPILSGPAGNYVGYLEAQGQHLLTVSHPAYGRLPPTTLTINADQSLDFYLPPDDDVVTNGSLELGNLAGWPSVGWARALRASARSGQFGASLGQDLSRVAPAVVAGSSGGSWPQAEYGSDGTLHLAWHAADSVFYARCAVNQACSAPQVVSAGSYPQLAVGPDGAVHLLWLAAADGFEKPLLYAVQPPAGAWSMPVTLGTAYQWYTGMLDLAVDSTGNVHAAWSTTISLQYRRMSSGAWGPVEAINAAFGEPALAVAANGDVHLVWGGATGSGQGHILRTQAGWGEPHVLDTPYYHARPAMVLDADGAAHVLWMSLSYDYAVLYARRDAEGSWTQAAVFAGSYALSRPQLAVQPNGQVIAAWVDWSSPPQRFAFTYLTGTGAWSNVRFDVGPAQIGERDFALAAHPTTNQLAHVGQIGYEAQSPINLSKFDFLPEQSSVSRLQQSLTVSPAFHRPTLSLDYRLTTEDEPGNDAVSISLTDGLSTTTWLTAPVGSGWSHAWLDVTPWQGATLTLTVELSQTGNGRYTWLEVDDVSLGSWNTPQIAAVTPAHIENLATLSATLIITGANFIPTPLVFLGDNVLQNITWLSDDQLRANVPVTIRPGIYDLRVLNAGGQEAVLSGAVVIGRIIFLPILWR
jgi:hypothetical protein